MALAGASTYSAYAAFISGATSLPQDVGSTLVQAILLFAFPLVFSAVGGALVMMALGVRGRRTFVISSVAFVAGAFLAYWATRLLFVDDPYQTVFTLIATAYLITVSLIVVLAVPPLSSLPFSVVGRVITAVAALLLLFLALNARSDREAIFAAVIAWILLPALMVLGSSTSREPT